MISRRIIMSSGAGEPYWINAVTSVSGIYWGGNPETNYYGRSFYGVAVDTNKNSYVTLGDGYAGGGRALLKYDSKGVFQWSKYITTSNYISSGVNNALNLSVDSNNNVVVPVIGSNGTNSGPGYIQVSPTGTILSQYAAFIYGGSATSVKLDSSNNAYIGGSYKTGPTGNDISVLTKLNSSGTILWSRNYLAGSYGVFNVGLDATGNVYACSYSVSDTFVSYISKYDSSGTNLWKFRSSGNNLTITGFEIDSSAMYISASGDTTSYGIAKFDLNGNLIWQRAGNNPTHFCKDSGGNLYTVAGSKIVKYNNQGVVQWARDFSHTTGYGTTLRNITADSTGSLYISGYSTLSPIGTSFPQHQGLLIKVPSDGSLTGTYGNYAYTTSTVSDSAGTGTFTTQTVGQTSVTLSPITLNYTLTSTSDPSGTQVKLN